MSTIQQDLQRVQDAYFLLIDALNKQDKQLSLEELLELDTDYAYNYYHPNKYQASVEANVKAFCEANNIWHDGVGDVYNTMSAYLHPITVDEDHLLIIGKFYGLLFYIDDYNGNDRLKFLPPEEQERTLDMMARIRNYLRYIHLTGKIPEEQLGDHPVEKITTEIMEEFHDYIMAYDSRQALNWFKEFSNHLLNHLREAIIDQDKFHPLTVDEYIELRDQVSGMEPTVMLTQFSRDNYIPYDLLTEYGIAEMIHELELQTVRYAGFVNDLFSFYKEVVEDQTLFNLIAIEFLNGDQTDPASDFLDAVYRVSNRVNLLRRNFLDTAEHIESMMTNNPTTPDVLIEQVLTYIEDLRFGMVASWRWQFEEGLFRYARHRDKMLFSDISLP